MSTLLVIDDEPNILLCFRRAFRDEPLEVVTADSAGEGLALARAHRPDVAIVDLCLPDGSGLDVFRALRREDPNCLVIIITAHGSTESAIQATKEGAFDYLLKPLEVPLVRETVVSALRIRDMMHAPESLAYGASSPSSDSTMIGRSPAMQAVYKAIGRAAPQNVNVLILGESGTGKELVARSLHQHSRRAGSTFLAVNCAAIPETLLESELFGHEKGAFTGADRRRTGKFEQCHGGTLFLDEIGELSSATQAKLLRVLQDRCFQPLGSTETICADVRIVAATNRDLDVMVREGRFRADLYFRLADFSIELPPLRERLDDLPELVQYLLRRLNAELGTDITRVHDEAMLALSRYPWPGNVRELQNTLRTSMLHATGPVLLPQFLPARITAGLAGSLDGDEAGNDDFRRLLLTLLDEGQEGVYHTLVGRLDRLVLEVLHQRTGGNQVQMSRILGITRNTLRAKLRAAGMLPRLAETR